MMMNGGGLRACLGALWGHLDGDDDEGMDWACGIVEFVGVKEVEEKIFVILPGRAVRSGGEKGSSALL
jgi:hypothetical protein